MDKRLPRRSLQSRTIGGLLDEFCACQSDAYGSKLSEVLDAILIGPRLQEFGIFSGTLPCGQQKDCNDRFYLCVIAGRFSCSREMLKM